MWDGGLLTGFTSILTALLSNSKVVLESRQFTHDDFTKYVGATENVNNSRLD